MKFEFEEGQRFEKVGKGVVDIQLIVGGVYGDEMLEG